MPTHLDILNATLTHEPHEGFLYYASFTPDLEERVLAAYGVKTVEELAAAVGMYHPLAVSLRPPAGHVRPDFTAYYADMDVPDGSYIDANGVLHVPGSMYHFTHYISPLRNAASFEDIESFPYPDVSAFSSAHMKEEVEAAHAAGRPVTFFTGHMYETAWQIRGYEQFLVDMLQRPEWCEYILDRLMERNKTAAVKAAEAGIDVLRTGDDVANQNTLMFSIDQWRRFMKPRWAEVYAAARAANPGVRIWYHSDGNVMEIIPELIEIGVTILNPVQPECMDPVEVKRRFGDRIVIDGAVGTQTTMPFGSPEDVRRTVRERADTLGADGAYIISPTHVLEPEVPVENVQAFFEAAGEL